MRRLVIQSVALSAIALALSICEFGGIVLTRDVTRGALALGAAAIFGWLALRIWRDSRRGHRA
jgi:hypothetical protein